MKRDLEAEGRLPGEPRLYNVEEGPADLEGLNLADARLPLSGWRLKVMVTLRGPRGFEKPLQVPDAPAGHLPSSGTAFLGPAPRNELLCWEASYKYAPLQLLLGCSLRRETLSRPNASMSSANLAHPLCHTCPFS